jgi:hypothetical protein
MNYNKNMKLITIVLIVAFCVTIYAQQEDDEYVFVPPSGYRKDEIRVHKVFYYFYQLTIEEKLEEYFNRFRENQQGANYHDNNARMDAFRIVVEHGPDIIPHLKYYVNNTNYILFWQEPYGDNTLALIAFLFNALHGCKIPPSNKYIKEYILDDNDIKYFIDSYTQYHEEYCIKFIDEDVITSNEMIEYVMWTYSSHINYITGENWKDIIIKD